MPTNNKVEIEISAVDDASRILNNAIAAFDRLERQVDRTEQSLKDMDRSTTDINTNLRNLDRNVRKNRTSLDAGRRSMDSFSRSTRSGVTAVFDLSNVYLLAAQALSRLADFGARQLRGFIEAGIRLENTRTAFTSLFGSAEEAEQAIAKLR